MAQRTILELVDDLDGGQADETVSFALDGVEFEIDLSAENAERLRDTIAEYVGHARRTGGRKQRGASPAKTTSSSGNGKPDTRWYRGTLSLRAWRPTPDHGMRTSRTGMAVERSAT